MTPTKLFISYPSESWNFAQRIADHLAQRVEQTIFIDYRSIDQVDFADSILKHLRESDAVILMITEFTFADIHRDHDWIRLEIRTALEHGIPIVLAREDGRLPPVTDLPDDVRAVGRSQGTPFYRELFEPGIDLLTDFLVRIGVATRRRHGTGQLVSESAPPPNRTIPASEPTPPQRTLGVGQALDEAADLLEADDFEKALFLLNAIDRTKVRAVSLPILDDLLAHAESMRALFERRREASLDYDEIVRWAKRRLTEAKAGAAFAAWCTSYPDLIEPLDTAGLRDRFALPPPPPPLRRAVQVNDILPAPFEWCRVPEGPFRCGEPEQRDNPPRTLTLPAFEIAKYPVTWEQFQVFLDADDGFQRHDWWAGLAVKAEHRSQPDAQKFEMAKHPREGVSWYDSIAFCRWLSHRLGGPHDVERPAAWAVRLPTEWEWEKAARGTDGLAYPYGNRFDQKKSTTRESGIQRTTPVTAYPGGASPFGVLDMSGNVWQWTLGTYDQAADRVEETELLSSTPRVVRGGSWDDYLHSARAAVRGNYNPTLRSYYVGFRVMRPPSR
ncbi:MAG: SUMF1/EgtB/PvdO family nonheme iron enzyme [bacterium]|nr:SUMF1/EgtB/PvdO family nonheme iron enzyme [bacterium]